MITVVSGLPRSGTSMLMQMLAAGGLPPLTDEARAADASNPRGYWEHARVRALAKDSAWLREAEGRAVKIIAQLVAHLPPGPAYRVLFLERSLDEVLASQARMLERLGRPAVPATTLRPAFEAQLARAHAALAARSDAEVLTVRHADVLADPRAAARRIAAFLDAGLDAEAMATAVDPALYRERTAQGV